MSEGSRGYVQQQIDVLREHLGQAASGLDAEAVHKARVASRRLKSAITLLEPLLESGAFDSIAKLAKQLRRELGELRDSDVMLKSLGSLAKTPRLAAAADDVSQVITQRRSKRYDRSLAKLVKPKWLRTLGEWDALSPRLAAIEELVLLRVSESLHTQFEELHRLAVSLSDGASLDIHELRIIAKELRYTFELADAAGHAVPARIARQFKAMQDDLGAWHDDVVLSEIVLRLVLDRELHLHETPRAIALLTLSQFVLQRSARSLQSFIAKWNRGGETIAATIESRFPLTRDPTSGESPV